MPRTDKKRNVWKVAKELVKNPHATEREIAEKTWLWCWTVNRAKKELVQNGAKDTTIQYIVTKAKENLNLAQQIQRKYLEQVNAKKRKLAPSEINEVSKISKDEMQRVTVLGWDITDEWWGLKILREDEEN